MTEGHPNTQLIDAVRDLTVAVALSELSEQETQHALDLISQLKKVCKPHRTRLQRAGFEAPREALERGETVWSTGLFNTVYPQVKMSFGDNSASALWTSRVVDEGPPGCVHGGVSAFLMDIMAGVLVQALGYRAVTGKLDLTYRRRVPLEETVRLESEVIRVDGRKIHVRARIVVDGEEAVAARGLFITIEPSVPLDGIAMVQH